MRITELIVEFELPKNSWELIISTADKHELGDDLVGLVQKAYSNTPQGSFVNSLKDVVPSDWEVIDWDNDPGVDSTVFFRGSRAGETWKGHKIQGIGHDGQQQSKQQAISKVKQLLQRSGWWIESSDAMRHILSRELKPVTDVDLLRKLFNDDKLTMVDNMTYVRQLPTGQRIKETVFGNPVL